MAWFGRRPAVSRPTVEPERSPLRANAEAAAGWVVPLEKVVDLLAAIEEGMALLVTRDAHRMLTPGIRAAVGTLFEASWKAERPAPVGGEPTEAEIAEAYREYLAVVGSPVPADLTVVAMRQLRYRAWHIGYEERMAAVEKRLDDLARRAIAAGWECSR